MSFGEHFAEVVDENSELSNTRLVRIRDCFFFVKVFFVTRCSAKQQEPMFVDPFQNNYYSKKMVL